MTNKKIVLPSPPPEYSPQEGNPPSWFSAMLRESGFLTPSGDMSSPNAAVATAVIMKAFEKNLK